MSKLLDGIERVLLMGPGPSTIPAEVYEALARPTLSHLDPYFISIMDELKENLRKVFATSNEATFVVSGTGTAGMEACLTNLIEPGDSMLIPVNGYFSQRLVDMASRLGAAVDAMEFAWGSPVETGAVTARLQEKVYKLVALVHAETSTGVCNPVREIAAAAADHGALFIVDAVTSLGGIEILPDEWGIDALYSCSQKCMAGPPGLSPVTFSARAVKKAELRRTKAPNFYLDLNLLMKYWNGATRTYHHTAPANMYFAIVRASEILLHEGREKVFARHRDSHEYLVSALEALGMSMLVEKPFRLPMLNTVRVPDGVDEAAVRRELRRTHGIEIGAGLGSLAGKIWRIGLMGHTARRENVDRLIGALKTILPH